MRHFKVIYLKKDSVDVWTCNASRLLECIKKFEREVGSWVDIVLEWSAEDVAA
jgi:hypothetical protein